MAVEARRGCGYRKVGGLYLVGSGQGLSCDRLPIALEVCPCCGQGIKQTRGWTWVDIAQLVGGNHVVPELEKVRTDFAARPCNCPPYCPLCYNVKAMGKGGLVWIGTQFYPTVAAFETEARMQGISRRITAVPRGFEVGKHFVLLAHPRGVIKPTGDLMSEYVPAIFRVWKPERLERIFNESQRNSEEVKEDVKRGITPVFVPDDDRDHHGSVYDKEEPEVVPSGEATPGLFQ